MLQGKRITLHKNTVCIVYAAGKPYDSTRCRVVNFDATNSNWRVRLVRSNYTIKCIARTEMTLISFAGEVETHSHRDAV